MDTDEFSNVFLKIVTDLDSLIVAGRLFHKRGATWMKERFAADLRVRTVLGTVRRVPSLQNILLDNKFYKFAEYLIEFVPILIPFNKLNIPLFVSPLVTLYTHDRQLVTAFLLPL